MTMQLPSEDELLKKLRRGDEKTFELIFREYFVRLCLFAEHYVRDKQAAEDIVEDLFCELWDNAGELNIQVSISGYLHKSVCNRCLKYLRHKDVVNGYRQKQLLSAQKMSSDQAQGKHIDPCNSLISKELESSINTAIENLPPQCARIFAMSRFRNMTYPEIAEELSISVNTVKTQMTRALKNLRDALKDYLHILIFFCVHVASRLLS
jgi:RNA polymerase sigma-70 factor (ECF subfamily)